jgi:hypothetical protein
LGSIESLAGTSARSLFTQSLRLRRSDVAMVCESEALLATPRVVPLQMSFERLRISVKRALLGVIVALVVGATLVVARRGTGEPSFYQARTGAPVPECRRIAALVAEPSETNVGRTIGLSATVAQREGLPSRAEHAWRASGGVLTRASTPNATLACTTEGEIEVTLDVIDGDCRDSFSMQVDCIPAEEELEYPTAQR